MVSYAKWMTFTSMRNDSMWSWEEPQQKGFENIKGLLRKTPSLALYNAKVDTVITAAAYGLGEVLV